MLRKAGYVIAGKVDKLAAATALKMKMLIAAAVLMGVLVKDTLALVEAAQLTLLRHAAQLAVQGAFAQSAVGAEGVYYFIGGVLLLLPRAEEITKGFVLHCFIHLKTPLWDGIVSQTESYSHIIQAI